MRKLILIVHTSLDGFVAGPNGELDGFDNKAENLEFVVSLTETADSALFGRISFQLLESYWPTARDHPGATKGEVLYSNWYNQAHKIVFSKTLSQDNLQHTTILREIHSEEINKIKNQRGENILIFGSPSVAQQMMPIDLIDEFWIFINPIVFGTGIPLFNEMADKIKLKLLNTHTFSNGEIALHYISDKKINVSQSI
jgi:dihydrofolate reductase